ncbi:MAG TPA: YbaB/EbfC family nucleoid-associated protein [Thermopolyspora sp.]
MTPARFGDDFYLSDLERVTEFTEQVQRRLDIVRGELDRVIGVGESADGKVRARTDANGRVLEVALKPRAMEMSSRDLGEEITLAIRRAQDDGEEQGRRLLHEAGGESMSSPEEIMGQFQQVANALNRVMDESEARIDGILRDIGEQR